MDGPGQAGAARSSGILIGILCGTGAAFGWAVGFVAAKHGVGVGFTPADLAFHRFFWSGLLLMPIAFRDGLINLGGIGWGRGLAMSILSGPPQAVIAYTGFMLVPLGHGTTIQPACAALFGLILATAMLGEKATLPRIFGGATIVAGLMVFGAESLATIGRQGVGGDLLFVTAGFFWALVRHAAALLPHVGHARGGHGRRIVGGGVRAALRDLHRVRQYPSHEPRREPGAGGGAGHPRRRLADLSVRARDNPDRRRPRGNVSRAGAGFLADHRLSRARRGAEHSTARRPGDRGDRIPVCGCGYAFFMPPARRIFLPCRETCS